MAFNSFLRYPESPDESFSPGGSFPQHDVPVFPIDVRAELITRAGFITSDGRRGPPLKGRTPRRLACAGRSFRGAAVTAGSAVVLLCACDHPVGDGGVQPLLKVKFEMHRD